MTRCQMRALKQLRELHEAYDKHDWLLAGSIQWYESTEALWMCPCGTFMYDNFKGIRVPFERDTDDDVVLRAHDCLNNARKELFKAFLKRIDWVPNSKKAARILFGAKGKTYWQLTYGHYETVKDWQKAKEDKYED